MARIAKFDNVKFFLIVLVVVGHFIDGAAGTSDHRTMRALFVFIYSFHMPLFVFLLGLFTKDMSLQSCFDGSRAFFFIILGFLSKILISISHVVVGHAFSFRLLSDGGIPWFMFAAAAFLMLAWLLRNIEKRLVLIVSIVLGLMVGYDASIGDYLYLSRICVFFPFFWLGYCLSPSDVLSFAQKRGVKILAVVVVVVIAFVCLHWTAEAYSYRGLLTGRNPYDSTAIPDCGWLNRFVAYSVSAMMSLAVLALVPSCQIRLPNITTFGTRTLQVYVWHAPLVVIIRNSGFLSVVENAFFPEWFYLIMVGVVLSFLLSLHLFSIPLKPLLDSK